MPHVERYRHADGDHQTEREATSASDDEEGVSIHVTRVAIMRR
jgi:hypothetical protein